MFFLKTEVKHLTIPPVRIFPVSVGQAVAVLQSPVSPEVTRNVPLRVFLIMFDDVPSDMSEHVSVWSVSALNVGRALVCPVVVSVVGEGGAHQAVLQNEAQHEGVFCSPAHYGRGL